MKITTAITTASKSSLGVLLGKSLWLILTLCLLTSCGPQPEPMLRVASNVWPGYELLYLARSLGYFQHSSIRLVEMQSASQVLHALGNGTVEAAALTLDEALAVMQEADIDLRVVLVIDISNGADCLLTREKIADLRDLRGLRIGVENTATGAVMLDAALERAGLTSQDIVIVPRTVNDHLHAWNKHEIDALVTFEPVRSQLLRAGAQEVFNSSQITGRILDVLVGRAEALQPHRASLQQLVAGFFAARHYWLNNSDDAAMRMAPRLASPADQVAGLFQGLEFPDLAENRKWLAGENSKLRQSANQLAELMQQHRLLQLAIQLDAMAEPGLLPEEAR